MIIKGKINHKIRVFLTVLTVFIYSNLLIAQDVKFSDGVEDDKVGIVIDSVSGKPLGGLLIIIESIVDNKVLAVEKTSKKGLFKIPMQDSPIAININSIGQKVQRYEFDSIISDTLKIFYISSPIVLSDVELTPSEVPVYHKGDTITFKAAYYRDSTERSVKELIENIPGINIHENGIIWFRGRPVQRVLVGGDDLFGRQYSKPIEVLDNRLFEAIEIIDNYSDNPVMGEFYHSNVQVMNLKLEESARVSFSGFGKLKYGYGTKHYSTLNGAVFQLHPDYKTMLVGDIGNHSTISNPVLNTRVPEFKTYKKFNEEKIFPRRKPILSNPVIGSSLIDNSRKYNVQLSNITSIKDNIQLKTRINNYQYLYKHKFHSFKEYLYDDKLLDQKFNELQKVHHKFIGVTTELQFYDDALKNNVFLYANASFNPIQSSIAMRRSSINDSSTEQLNNSPFKQFSIAGEHTLRLSSRWLIKSMASLRSLNSSSHYSVLSDINFIYFPLNNFNRLVRSLNQVDRTQATKLRFSTTFIRVNEKSNLDFTLYATDNRYKYSLSAEGIKDSATLNYGRMGLLHESYIGILIESQFDIAPEHEMTLSLSQSVHRFNNFNPPEYWFPTQASIAYDVYFNYQWKMVNRLSYSSYLPSPSHMLNLGYYSKYNVLKRFGGFENPLRDVILFTGINYMNVLNQLEAYLSIRFKPYSTTLNNSYDIIHDLIILQPYQSSNSNFATSLRLKKFVSSLKTTLSISPSYQVNNYIYSMNKTTYLNHLEKFQVSTEMEFKTWGFLIHSINFNYSYSINDNEISRVASNSIECNASMRAEINKLRFEINFKGAYYDVYKYLEFIPDLNCNIRYQLHFKNNTDVNLYLNAYNLLNRKSVVFEAISDQLVTGSSFELIPFHVMGGVEFYF